MLSLMRVTFLFLAGCVPMIAAQPNTLSAEEKAAGWVLLFDGVTPRGWLEVTGLPFPTTSWTVEDGCLKGFPNPDGIQDIRTVDTYRSFDLRFEWKILKGGNSGVKYLVQRTDRWQRKGEAGFQARARGLEYQIVDEENRDGADPKRKTGALYSAMAPRGGVVKPFGEFNESRILVRNDHVEHWLNGVRVLAFDLTQPEALRVLRDNRRSDDIVRISPICLQNHGAPVWFRNLKIRRLD